MSMSAQHVTGLVSRVVGATAAAVFSLQAPVEAAPLHPEPPQPVLQVTARSAPHALWTSRTAPSLYSSVAAIGIPEELVSSMEDTFSAVAQVAVLAGAGFMVRRVGILDKDSTKALSKVTLSVLLPSLLLTRLALLEVSDIVRARGLPLGLFCLIVIGLFIGRLCATTLNLPKRYSRSFVVGCAFGNGTSLGIILAIGVLALALPVQHIMMWLVGYNYVKGNLFPDSPGALPGTTSDDQAVDVQEAQPIVNVSVQDADAAVKKDVESAVSSEAAHASVGAEVLQTAKQLLNPPIIGVFIGLTLAFVPPLHNVWIQTDGPLAWLVVSLNRLGSAVVPMSMMTLGSNLSQGPGKGIEVKPIATMFVVRQLFMPMVGIALAVAFQRLGIFPQGDALPPLVLMVLASAPTANNIVTMATALGAGPVEISTCLFWQYVGFLGLQLLYIPLFVGIAQSM